MTSIFVKIISCYGNWSIIQLTQAMCQILITHLNNSYCIALKNYNNIKTLLQNK